MHPEMKAQIDKIVIDVSTAFSAPRPLIESIVNGVLICTKLQVLGRVEKGRKVNILDAAEKISNEVSCQVFLAFDIAEQLSRAVWDATPDTFKHGSNLQNFKAYTETYPQEKRSEIFQVVEKAMQPIIHQYFMGIDPGRKPS